MSNAQQFRGEQNKGIVEWYILNGAFILLAFATLGPVALSLVWLLLLAEKENRPLHSRKSIIITGVSGTVVTLYYVTVTASSLKAFWVLDPFRLETLVSFALQILGVPFYLFVARNMSRFSKFIKPQKLSEQLENHDKRATVQRRRDGDRAKKVKLTAPRKGLLRIGSFIKGDNLERGRDLLNLGGTIGLTEKALDQHIFIQGATGAGKSETLKRLIFEILQSTNRDIIFVDGKGDEGLALEVRSMANQFGRGLMPVFKMGQGKYGAVYNGFNGQAEDIYNRLAMMIGVREAEGAAAYYADINRDLLQLICYAPGGPPRSFEAIRTRLSKDWLLAAYRNDPDEIAAIEKYSDRDIGGLAVRLSPLIREFKKYVGPEGFSIESERGCIFSLRTQSMSDTASRLLGFLMEDMKDYIGKRQKRPAVLIIDEYAQFPASSILGLLSLARSSRLGVILATQDVSSLGEDAQRQTIIANTTTMFLMKSNFPQYLAEVAGTKHQLETGHQIEEGAATGMGTTRVQHTFKVAPGEAKEQTPGQTFIIRNHRAVQCQVRAVGNIPPVEDQKPQIRRVDPKEIHNLGPEAKAAYRAAQSATEDLKNPNQGLGIEDIL